MNIDIKRIIDAEAIEVQMQLVISPNKDFTTAIEALSRGVNPDNGQQVSPLKLIHLAKKQNLTLELEALMLKKALEVFKPIYEESPQILLFINIGPDFMELSLENTLLDDTIKSFDIPVRNIVFDVGAFEFGRLAVAKEFVDQYRAKGYYICIDDLGLDYVNIDKVLFLNPDLIKILIQPIRKLTHRTYVVNMLKTLRLLAESMGIIIVANGIEDESDISFAIEHGAQFMQGYYISRPTDLTKESLITIKERYRSLMEAHSMEEESRLELTRAMTTKAYGIIRGVKQIIVNNIERPRSEKAQMIFDAYPMVENYWILDDKGLQNGQTFINQNQFKTKNTAMFQIYNHGSDFSTKDLFTQLYSTILDIWVTPPIKSVLTNNLCIGCSTRLDLSCEYAVIGVNINVDRLSDMAKASESLKADDYNVTIIQGE